MLPFKGKNALIIEDDETSIMVLQKLLQHMGLNVMVIRDSIEASRQLRQVALPDVIFLDLEMPQQWLCCPGGDSRNRPHERYSCRRIYDPYQPSQCRQTGGL